MDRLSQLRGEAGGSRDSTLDTTSPPSESFMTANESSSKYYSLSEIDSTFDISTIKDDITSIKDVSLASTTTKTDGTITNADDLISRLSPIGKKSDILDSYKIDTQIEAANILSGGVAIFDDNDNSYDGHELVIDDNVEIDEKSNLELKQPDSLPFKTDENIVETSLISEGVDIASKDTEVVLQINGKSVEAINIGNGLYLYRKSGQEELAAVQISDDDHQQGNFKFLKVRSLTEEALRVKLSLTKEALRVKLENAEGNLEVYEEIQIEVPKEVPAKEGNIADKNTSSHVPIMDINKVISEAACSKVAERKNTTPRQETITSTELQTESKESSPDNKSEVNLNGKMIKFSETKKSPVIGSFTPMTYHSTPNKEGIPLTKTMVDQQLHPNRHSDSLNVKKTIEVHTDSGKQKAIETLTKNKDVEGNKLNEITTTEKEFAIIENDEKDISEFEDKEPEIVDNKESTDIAFKPEKPYAKDPDDVINVKHTEQREKAPIKQHDIMDSKENLSNQNVKENTLLQMDALEKDKSDEDLNQKEAKTKEKIDKADEVKMAIINNDQVSEANIESVIQVESEPDEGKDEPMEIDAETKLTIVDAVLCVEQSKTILEENIKTVQEGAKDVKLVEDKTEGEQVKALVVDERILIGDDDVSIVEEVIIENKEDILKPEDNELCHTKSKVIVVDDNKHTVEVIENVPKADDDNKLKEEIGLPNKNLPDKENIQEVLSSSNSVLQKCKKDLRVSIIEQEDKTDIAAFSATEQEKYPNLITLPIQNELVKDVIASSSSNISNKDFKPSASQAPKNDLIKSPTDQSKDHLRDKRASEPPKTSDDKQIVKPNDFSETNNATSKQTTEHDIATKISPLLDQTQITLIGQKVIKEKQIVHDEIEIKKASPSVQDARVTAEQKIKKQMLELSSKTERVNIIHVTESLPIVTQMPTDSNIPVIQIIEGKAKEVVDGIVDIQKSFIPQPVINITLEKTKLAKDDKNSFTCYGEEKKDIKQVPKNIASVKGKGMTNIEITKVPKLDPPKTNVVVKQDVSSSTSKMTIQNVNNKNEPKVKKDLPQTAEPKAINNNHAAVPFGKWTEANRQEFLNKFKTKSSVASSNSNQLKNSNDLNRRDVLKKIDSQRQSNSALSKTQEANKLNMKPETAAFSNKPNIPVPKEVTDDAKIPQKTEVLEEKPKAVASSNITKTEVKAKPQTEQSQTALETSSSKKETCQRTGVVQNLIDKTIEGMIHRSAPAPKSQDEPNQQTNKELSTAKSTKPQQTYQRIEQATLDAIEMKMNELHGIPFIERPPHELPQVHKADPKGFTKIEAEKPAAAIKTKIPNLLPFPNKNQQKVAKETVIEVESEDEIIEHEPITGDIDVIKKSQVVKPSAKEMLPSNVNPQIQQEKSTTDATKKEAIITEKDFDKFARRNSMTYENCLTVNFDGKEPHNVVQTVVEKDPCPKSYSRNDNIKIDPKAKLPYKYQNVRPNTHTSKVHTVKKFGPANDDASNRNQSKLQKAYHSALTTKRQLAAECPITIIEDKPVKVVYIDSVDYVPSQLNVQGQDLSPAKRAIADTDVTVSTCDSLDSDLLDSIDDGKTQDEVKIKTKHQRKQVLTPVDEPELELIEPGDLGIEVSPKKKRRTDDDKAEKNLKYPIRKKFYMLSSSAVAEEKVKNPVEVMKNPLKEAVNLNDNGLAHTNPISALDSLVKAAELIETQMENRNINITTNSDNQLNTPVKRGRGRPRKYPLTPEGTVDKNKVVTPSPQKKPRLIDAKVHEHDSLSDNSNSDGEIIKENWTMGKINENIVCPICNKLFRTENVVFKHVKHCTSQSPSRSDSDKRSPRRMRISQDFDTKSRDSNMDMDIDDDKPLVTRKESPKKRKSKDSVNKSDDKDDVIIIEDTPVKEKSEKIDDQTKTDVIDDRAKREKSDERKKRDKSNERAKREMIDERTKKDKIDERKHHESRKPRTKIAQRSNLVCEFCGKTFRQLSYLVSHKLQHKKLEKEEPKKIEKDALVLNKSVYSCEVCKKEFRKLHHLVQHRIIHNPNSVPARSLRKTSSEQSENKLDKESSASKQSDDPSAGFRCEPCDKSFRKLHHLVEHRETHDGINRQKTTTALPNKEEKPIEKSISYHQCDICKETFKKLQHLNEHKEQHIETSSEKSDDKSVKSSLSTKDIIHECSLCYMVFPNEHSLTKHTIICQRKKRQSKQLTLIDKTEGENVAIESVGPEEKVENIDSSKPTVENTKKDEEIPTVAGKIELVKDKPANELEGLYKEADEPVKVVEILKLEATILEQQMSPAKRDFVENESAKTESISEVPVKIKKIELEPIKIHETPKKKTPLKDKSTTKRLKTIAAPTSVTEDVKFEVESSDDDDVRYMLNPNYKVEAVTEEKVFMKVRAKKRSSLQIERPNSKDLVKRRTSLQHPPKIPRLKPKPVVVATATTVKKVFRTSKLEPVPSTDSDDSETTKYSFPTTIPEKPTKPAQERSLKDTERKIQRKSLDDKRKSLTGIAKRKSLGKVVTARHKALPLKQIKKRTLDAEHRCDCGQLFSSAALLSRHTTLAHTPPRIRRRRSPPPEEEPVVKPALRKSSVAEKLKQNPLSRKSCPRSDNSSIKPQPAKNEAKPSRKPQVKDSELPSGSRKAQPEKSEAKSSVKPRRTMHRGVPVPEKMKKLMQKK